MARHASTQIPPAMQCTQRLDPSLLDQLIVETRSIEELDLDGARIAPFLTIDVRVKPPPPPLHIDVSEIEIVEPVMTRPSLTLSAQPGGTVAHAARRWWIASSLIILGTLAWALIWKVM
jgi:hypothetical protein